MPKGHRAYTQRIEDRMPEQPSKNEGMNFLQTWDAVQEGKCGMSYVSC